MDVNTVKPGNIVKVQEPIGYAKTSPQVATLYEVKTVYKGRVYGMKLAPLGIPNYAKDGSLTFEYPEVNNSFPYTKFEVIA